MQGTDVIIPDVVDETIFCLLDAIDNDLLHLVFVSPDGTTVDLTKEGRSELGGWFMGIDESWRTEYSTERIGDDSAALVDGQPLRDE